MSLWSRIFEFQRSTMSTLQHPQASYEHPAVSTSNFGLQQLFEFRPDVPVPVLLENRLVG